MKQIFVLVIISVFCNLNGQSQFTKFDKVPGNIMSYKPAYQVDYPEWAQMMYQEDINYNEVNKLFLEWESQNVSKFRPIRRYYKLWSQHIRSWVADDGSIQLDDIGQYYKDMYLHQKSKSDIKSVQRSAAEWTFLGPKETFFLNDGSANANTSAASWQANVYSFDIAESNDQVLYVGTETGYINKSVDKGNTWSQVGLDYNFGSGVTAVAIHPLNEDIVYASASNQVNKSIDGGLTWTPLLAANNGFTADRLEIDKENPSKILASTSSGLYISNNDGNTWTRAYFKRTYDAHRHPSNPDIIYALCKSGSKFEMIISINAGESFESISDFPDRIDISGGLIAVSTDEPNALFTILLSTNNTPYLYKTENALSASWNLIATGGTTPFEMDNGQGYFDLVLGVSDENSDLIYTGTASLYKSTNGGSNFTKIGGYGGDFPIHPDIQDIKTMKNGEIWVATDGGMSYSSDNFTSLSNYRAMNKGLVGSDMWGFDQGWNEDIVVGGRYHNGNTAIADFYGNKAIRMGGAESPTGWVLKGKSRHVAFDDLGAGWILPATADAPAEGRFIFSKFPNMDEYGGRRGNIAYHPNYFGHIYIGEGNSIWRSTDTGMNYDMIYSFSNNIRYVDIAFSDPDILYADVISDGLMKSEDGGLTWEKKPSLTSFPNGNSNWGGRLFFAISPTDANRIYACLQNGTWSEDIGRVFKSEDGGDTWKEWTDNLTTYTKSLVVQPGENGEDIVYLFSNAKNQIASVKTRKQNDETWTDYSDGFPAGFDTNLALPFFRDSKLRAAGDAGIWETDLLVKNFAPVINPWVEKKEYNCLLDTVLFEDHSIINHEGASWKWKITPTPAFISDVNVRNPSVVLGEVGSYDVTMTITKNGEVFTKTIENMVSTSTCPSLDDCNNPAKVPQEGWTLEYVDSEESVVPGLATMAFDNDPNTIWHTRWTSGNDVYPHELIIALNDNFKAQTITYLPRQTGVNGRIKDYEFYLSNDGLEWGEPVATGAFENSSSPQSVFLGDGINGQYLRLVALSEVNGEKWASIAELTITGCYANSTSTVDPKVISKISAFPMPNDGKFSITLPASNDMKYQLTHANGKVVSHGNIVGKFNQLYTFDLQSYESGLYYLSMITDNGIRYNVSVIKM